MVARKSGATRDDASTHSGNKRVVQESRNLRSAALVHNSFPELVLMSRLTYVVLAVICYTLASTMWMEDTVLLHDLTQTMKTYDSVASTVAHVPKSTIRKANENINRNDSVQMRSQLESKAMTVAYVVTITGCGHDLDIPFQIAEGAAVLQYSIHQNSVHGIGRYDYQLYAFYHPEASSCAATLADLGYTVQERETPVQVNDIENELLRERIVKNGCCGEKELIKLEAFTLTDHPVVVLLDLDVLVLQPLDRLFDFILDSKKLPSADDLLHRTNTSVPETRIDLLYTTDYAMVNPERKIKPTQGGFAVLRPNMTVYDDFVSIVRKGDFRMETNGDMGWGGETGRFWGALTFQGLIPYYYQILHPGRAVELNWCVWNNMCSPSRDKGIENDQPVGKCFTQLENCEDCRNRPIDEIGLTHFTICQKPWTCQLHEKDAIENRLCRSFHHAWFKTRSEMEQSWGRSGRGTSDFHRDHFIGYCSRHGSKGYEKLAKPYGAPIAVTES